MNMKNERLTITYMDPRELKPAEWWSTYMLKPDRDLLSRSIEHYGIMQPIVIQKSSNTIIDGHTRVHVALDARLEEVPVVIKDVSNTEAMFMHLRLNRAKGQIVGKKMSMIIKDLLRSGQYSENDLKYYLVMKSDEMDLMVDGSLLKSRKVSDHKYSRAWVPVEAPAKATETLGFIERPPNPDR